MRTNSHFISYAFLALFLLFCFCSKSKDIISGNGSETENALSGRIVYEDGTPAAGVTVRILPVSNVPSFTINKIKEGVTRNTDENGYYLLNGIDSGLYNIEGLKESLGVFIDSILAYDNNKIPQGILKKCGSITGIIHMDGQSDTNQIRATLSMPGTRRITKPNIGGRFLFDYMPEGNYQLNIDPLPQYAVQIISLQVKAGQVLNLDTLKFTIPPPKTFSINLQLGCNPISLESPQSWASGIKLLDGSMGTSTPGYGISSMGIANAPGRWAKIVNQSSFPIFISVYSYFTMAQSSTIGPISDTIETGDSVFIYRISGNSITICLDGNKAISELNTLRPQVDGRTYFYIFPASDTTQDCSPSPSSKILKLSEP